MEFEGLYNNVATKVSVNSTGKLLVNNFSAKYQEAVLSGNVYSTGMTLTTISNATFTVATLDAACTPIVGVWNPVGSGKKLVILEAKLACILTALQATGGGSFQWATSIGNASISTGLAPFNRSTFNASGSVAKGFANTALTGMTNSLVVRDVSGLSGGSNINTAFLQTAVGTLPPSHSSVDHIDGAIIVPEGGVLALLCSTTPVAVSAGSSLTWLEI